MAYSFWAGDRSDERFRNGTNSRDETSFALNNNSTALRGNTSRMHSQAPSISERASLQRRFTTNNVSTVPELAPIGQPRRQAAEQPELLFMHTHKLLEQKQAEYEHLKKKRQAFQNEMDAIDARAKQDEVEMRRLERDLGQFNASGAGHQSEPTTPPEYSGFFPSALSNPNRFSASSVTSPPGLANRTSRAPSQAATSPPSERARAYQALTSELPSQSTPASHRNSDEEEDAYDEGALDLSSHRSAASLNRNSMPVTRRDRRNRNGVIDMPSVLGHVNTSSFLFSDEDDNFNPPENRASVRSSTDFLQMNMNDDKFPTLVRRDADANGKNRLSTMSTDLEPTSPQFSRPESQISGWGTFVNVPATKHMSMNGMEHYASLNDDSPTYSVPSSGQQTPTKTNVSNRHSMGPRLSSVAEPPKRPSILTSTSHANSDGGPPKLHSSWSTNDVPTIKSTQSLNGTLANMKAISSDTPEQRLHNHNASLGRIPADAINRQSRDLSLAELKQEEAANALRALQSAGLQGNAVQYGTTSPISSPTDSSLAFASNNHALSPLGGTSFYHSPYGMQMMNAMNNLTLGNQQQWNQGMQMYQMQYGSYNPNQFGAAAGTDAQTRILQGRKIQSGEESSRYANIALEDLKGEIYSLCKDQHGCRYLQKKLEDRKPEHVQMIFAETKDHMVELMTDPFGNYLCQKLLENTNDEQRTALVKSASPQMVNVALNQHGTRALQKLIDCISTREQIRTVIRALQDQVVPLIQDLNGNHVIQKCLNRLTAQDSQFIFDAVAIHCVAVGTHRHGCCVIQRCIDHASSPQKDQLVQSVTDEAFALVQDPFGNYVVQYILDLGDENHSEPLCRKFLGSIAELSKQKFSSNVMEKCIRIASSETRHVMIEEILNPRDLEKLLRDSFANYVIQTAMDFAEGDDKARLFESARPTMPSIRHTPYGRRIAAKIQEYDARNNGSTGTLVGMVSPSSSVVGSIGHFPSSGHQKLPSQSSNTMQSPVSPYNITNPPYGVPGFAMASPMSPPIHRLSNPPLPNMDQYSGQGPVQQPFFAYGRTPYPGMNNY